MQSSTDSAGEMLKDLSVQYNPRPSGCYHSGDHRGYRRRKSPKKEVKTMNKGKIVQVMGPVVDVVFEQGEPSGYQGRPGSDE